MIGSLNKSTDELGIASSALCIVHCAVTPFLLVSGASIGVLGLSDSVWGAINFVFLIVSFFAMLATIKKSSVAWLKISFVIAWVALLLLILNEYFEIVHISSPVDLTYFPAIALIALHVLNIRNVRRTEACYH